MADNTFRFSSYKDEISKKVVISFRNTHIFDEIDQRSTHTALALEKWSNLDTMTCFASFYKKISPYVASLKLLLLHQDLIASELLHLIQSCTKTSMNAALDILISFSCDIRDDFHQYYENFLPHLFKCVSDNYQDAELLQTCFSCLAHLVYFLRRPMSKDIESTLKLFSPLLKNQTQHIPRFTAECLGFLLRKLPDRYDMLLRVTRAMENDEKLISTLLSQVLCGSDRKFHSCAFEIIPLLFNLICKLNDTSKASTTVNGRAKRGLQSILKTKNFVHIDRVEISENGVREKTLLCNSTASIFASCIGQLVPSCIDSTQLAYILDQLTSFCENLEPSATKSLSDLVSILSVCLDSCDKEQFCNCEEKFGQAFSTAMKKQRCDELLLAFEKFLRLPLNRYNPFQLIRSLLLTDMYSLLERAAFVSKLTDWDLFDRDILPTLGMFLPHFATASTEEKDYCMFTFLPALCLTRYPACSEPCGEISLVGNLPNITVNALPLSLTLESTDLVSACEFTSLLLGYVDQLVSHVSTPDLSHGQPDVSNWSLIFCLPYINPLPTDRVVALLDRAIISIVTKTDYVEFIQLVKLLLVVEARNLISSHHSTAFSEINLHRLAEAACCRFANGADYASLALRIVDIVVIAGNINSLSSMSLPNETHPAFFDALVHCLQSHSHQVRLHSLRILFTIYGGLFGWTVGLHGKTLCDGSTTDDKASHSVLTVLGRCISAERVKLDPQLVREFLNSILHLHAHRVGVKDNQTAAEIALNHLLGLLHVQLTSTWPHIQEAISSYAEVRNVIADVPIESEKMDEAWRHVSARIYWSKFEPLLNDLSQKVMSKSTGSQAMEVDEPTSIDQTLFTNLVSLYRLKLDEIHSPIRQDKTTDWGQYYLSLWRCLRPTSAGKKSRLLTPLLFQILQYQMDNNFPKSKEELLLVPLSLFAQFHNIKSIYMEPDFRDKMYDLLTNRRPVIQKAALHCILAYKHASVNPYKDNLEKIIDPRTFRDEIRTFKLDVSLSNAKHRSQVAPLLLRILYGRILLSNNSFAPAVFTNLASCSNQEFTMFLQLLLNPLIEVFRTGGTDLGCGELTSSNRPLVDVIQALRKHIHLVSLGDSSFPLSWSKLQALSKVVNYVLDYMGHRLGTVSIHMEPSEPTDGPEEHVNILLRLGLCLLSMVQAVGDLRNSTNKPKSANLPLQAQVKQVRSTGVRLLGHLFQSELLHEEHYWECSERLDAVREVCLYPPMLDNMLKSSSVTTGHLLLTMAVPWSQSLYLSVNLLKGSALDTLIHMLTTSSVTSSVIEKIIEVIFNLIFVLNAPTSFIQEIFSAKQSQLINYMTLRMKNVARTKSLDITQTGHQSVRLEREFQILAYLATQSSSPTNNSLDCTQSDQLIQSLLSLLNHLNMRRFKQTGRSATAVVNSDLSATRREIRLASVEAIEASLIRALTQLMHIADPYKEHLIRIIRLFARFNSRVCRSLLCETVGVGIGRLPVVTVEHVKQLVVSDGKDIKRLVAYLDETRSGETLSDICVDLLQQLNSWDEDRLDTVDAAQRESAFTLLSGLTGLLTLDSISEHLLHIHLGGLNCALHTLCHADLQLRDSALDYCLRLAKTVAQSNPNQCVEQSRSYRLLILGCLWPELLYILRQRNTVGPKRFHLLRLVNGLVRIFREYKRFSPLALLLDLDSAETDFYTSIQSGTLTRQSYAIRRLALFLRNPLTIVSRQRLNAIPTPSTGGEFVVPERDLCGFILPLLQFYIHPQIQSSFQDEDGAAIGAEHKRLIEHCLDALGALASHLSWNQYQKLIAAYLKRLKSTGSADSSILSRVLINLIGAFQPPSWEISDSGGNPQRHIPLVVKYENGIDPDDDASVTAPVVLDVKGDQQKSVFKFMLGVIDRMKEFISKPVNADHNGEKPASSKTFRISLVIALVSLLRRLPPGSLEARLPHLILRIIDVLRPSRSILPTTRMEATKSLTRIARMLGPSQALDSIFRIVSQQLTRGYAAKQIRLYVLHKLLSEMEQAISAKEVGFKVGQLDYVGKILGDLYLDELMGSLAEEMDSRRSAGQSLSSIDPHQQTRDDIESFNTRNLGGSGGQDLPEASGLKAPDGITRLCRLLSSDGLKQLFTNIQSAVMSASAGQPFITEANKERVDDKTSASETSSVGCGLRFRTRALARLEATLIRLPTRHGIFSQKHGSESQSNTLIHLAVQLIHSNINDVLSADNQPSLDERESVPIHSVTKGWTRPRSTPLQPQWDYMSVDAEPTRESRSVLVQSKLTQAHLLVSCGLHILIGLLRYRRLNMDDSSHMSELGNSIPLVLDCLRSKYVRVLGSALRCLNFLFIIVSANSICQLIPDFTSKYLHKAGELLFTLLSTHPGLLSTKTAANDVYAQQFASNLYRALTSLVSHQSNYPLTRSQLLTLLNSVDIELNRDAAIAPSLSLLQAILQRRLRDPNLQGDEADFLHMSGDPELNAEIKGLVVAKSTDTDHQHVSGAGGGTRLLDLISRLQHLSITSSSDKVRADARCCLVIFLLNYPHKAKFVHSFVAFCLRQLEYKKPTGRLSAVSLLTGLLSDLPISRVTANHLDEAILISVGAAIERESVRSIRVGMLAMLRILFTRLPPKTAEAHFREYLLAFITAPSTTRSSARLLGLQLISAVLDSQPCLSVSACRPVLIKLLGTDVLPTAANQLRREVLTNSSVRSISGLNPLFDAFNPACPQEEVSAARAVSEDIQWVRELQLVDVDHHTDNEVDVDSDRTQVSSESEVEDLESADFDDDSSDTEREPAGFEQAEETARNLCDDLISDDNPIEKKSTKSSLENYYFLIACTLEHGLRLSYRLLAPTSEQPTTTSIIVSSSTNVLWEALFGLNDPDVTLNDSDVAAERRKQYSLLFSSGKVDKKGAKVGNSSSHRSLLCAGYRSAREWATRCLNPLLKLEVAANQSRLNDGMEAVGCRPKSAFLCELKKKRKYRIVLFERLLDDSLFQLEHDTKELMTDDWTDALLANLICLAQLLHLSAGRKPVLRLFRFINRLALDELNRRPNCYIQRSLTLKLLTGLLLHLPHPSPSDLSTLITKHSESLDPSSSPEQAPAYVAYLRVASRHLARELKQRERLAFIAAASANLMQGDEATDARSRLAGFRLSREQSQRARARRKKNQARLRRAVMSGTMRPDVSKNLLKMSAAHRHIAGPDQLIEMLEATETTLTNQLADGNQNLLQTVCSHASRGALARQHAHRDKKVVRTALGIAWVPPNRTESSVVDQPLVSKSKRIRSSRDKSTDGQKIKKARFSK